MTARTRAPSQSSMTSFTRMVRRDGVAELSSKALALPDRARAMFGAYEWARRFMTIGHTIRELIAPKVVVPTGRAPEMMVTMQKRSARPFGTPGR